MKTACEMQPSGLMTAFVGSKSKLDLARFAAKKWCVEKLKLTEPVICEMANYLNAQCKVIGGNTEALDFIELNYRSFGINRVKRLPVSGAFHTRLMESCEEPLENALKSVVVKKPTIQFYSNVSAERTWNEKRIKQNLVRQLSRPVKWEQILNSLYWNENLPLNRVELKRRLEETEKKEKTRKIPEVKVVERESDLNASPPQKTEGEESPKKEDVSKSKLKRLQDDSREYPDIYECGPGSVTGPILKIINSKAHQFYKHIDV